MGTQWRLSYRAERASVKARRVREGVRRVRWGQAARSVLRRDNTNNIAPLAAQPCRQWLRSIRMVVVNHPQLIDMADECAPNNAPVKAKILLLCPLRF